MDFKKLSGQMASDATPLPTLNVHVTESKSKASKLWGPLYAVGVFGCAFLLFHLYITTTVHHAAMDHSLHQLEGEVRAMMEMHHARANATASHFSPPVVHSGHGNHRSARRSRRRANEVALVKRGGGATLTWFHPGLGACGGHNGDNDFIIAISHLIWNGGAHCGDTVSISYRGKTVQATVADECMGCDPNHIDLSPGLLHHLAGPGTDMVSDATWSFGGAPAPPPEEKPKPQPTHTSTPPPPPPTTTSKAHPTTTTISSAIASTRTSSTTSFKASSTASSTSSTASASASQTPSYVDDGSVHNVVDFNVLLISIGKVAMSGVLAKA